MARIEIVDRGRGAQLSTCRITVQDLIPYFQGNFSHQQIREAMPILSVEEIQVAERYVREHFEEVMEEDRRIRERNAQRTVPAEIEAIRQHGRARLLALQEEFASNKKQGRNGDQLAR